MAFGDGPDDAALRARWEAFCERLRDAGGQAFKDYNPATPLHRADAFRFLTQNLGQAFDLALETGDPGWPHIHAFSHPLRKLGADAADFLYQQAWISGAHSYRVSGTKGSARFFNLTVQGARGETRPPLHEPFGDTPEANIFGDDIEASSHGSFELLIGGERRGRNWLPTTPASRKLFIRQGFDSWDETPWTLRIERIGMAEPRSLAKPEDMIEAFDWAGEFLAGLMRDWPDHPYRYSGGAVDPMIINAFPPAIQDGSDEKRGRAVANMVWRLAPHDALIVTFEPPDGAFWMASLGGVFMNSFDYFSRSVSFTPSRATVDSDGKIRLILCHEDPGYHNWLDACGFAQGNLMIRTLLRSNGPVIETLTVRRESLADHMPEDSPRVSPRQRQHQMLERFRGIQRQRFPG